MILVLSEASCEMFEDSHFRIEAWTSCACSVLATLPVPIALRHPSDKACKLRGHGRKPHQTGSYATTTFDQSLVREATAFNCLVTTSIVLSASRCFSGVSIGTPRLSVESLTSRVSPTHRITPSPASSAVFVLLAMNYRRTGLSVGLHDDI